MNAPEKYMEINKKLLEGAQTCSHTLWKLVSSEDKTEDLKLDILERLGVEFRSYGYRALKEALLEGNQQIAKYLLVKTQ